MTVDHTATTDAQGRWGAPLVAPGTTDHALDACVQAGPEALRALTLERLEGLALRVPGRGFYALRGAIALVQMGEPASALLTVEVWADGIDLPLGLAHDLGRAMAGVRVLVEVTS